MANDLSKQQVCQLYIEQEINKAIAEGKTMSQVGQEVSDWICKTFEAIIKPDSIRRRADRIKTVHARTDVRPEPTPEDDSEIQEIQVGHGGEREGAGRPPFNYAPEPSMEPRPKLPKLGPPRNGMQFARLAIMDLEKIQKNDLEREDAFETVILWIKKQRRGE